MFVERTRDYGSCHAFYTAVTRDPTANVPTDPAPAIHTLVQPLFSARNLDGTWSGVMPMLDDMEDHRSRH
jgi:hypothetical protein